MKKTLMRLTSLALVLLTLIGCAVPAMAESSQSSVRAKLDDIANGTLTYNSSTKMKVGGKFTGTNAGSQCKGYARNVWELVFGVIPGSTKSSPNNHQLNSANGMKLVAADASLTAADAETLFSGARIGDFVQMRRTHGGSHSAIVYAIDAGGVTWLEANMDNNNGVSINTYTWAKLAAKNEKMSVYTVTSYTAPVDQKVNTTSSKSSATPAQIEALLFDYRFYYDIYPDLQKALGCNESALKAHWQKNGIREGRVASPFFDAKWYMKQNPDVAAAYGATNWEGAYTHFINHGFNEGREGSPYFSANFYLDKYDDLKKAYGSDYLSAAKHFLSYGLKEQRQASSQFSIKAYNQYNKDVVKAFPEPLYRISHYICYVQYGKESRRCL